MHLNITNPKRVKQFGQNTNYLFDYYAGYSPVFVSDVLKNLDLTRSSKVIDPWNGSGTTTTTACSMGIRSIGLDINPVMVIVSKASLLSQSNRQTIAHAMKKLVSVYQYQMPLSDEDPLLTWFSNNTANAIRTVVNGITLLLTEIGIDSKLYAPRSVNKISPTAAFFYVAVFKAVRSLLWKFYATNPTWIKSPKTKRNRLRTSPAYFRSLFVDTINSMLGNIVYMPSQQVSTKLIPGDSTALPSTIGKVQAIVSSPPYCTRIDYAIATKIELAILGVPFDKTLHSLRSAMIGAPVISKAIDSFSVREEWGDECLGILNKILLHPSKGSVNYYYKIFAQYFSQMHASLSGLSGILTEGGDCVLVVQDSFYKSDYIDIAKIIVQMCESINWHLWNRFDFPSSLLMARMNPRTKVYRKNATATESVLWFKSER